MTAEPLAPPVLHWSDALDAGDRAAFFGDIARAALAADALAVERSLSEWRTTALALSDPARREILTGTHDPADFTEVQRP